MYMSVHPPCPVPTPAADDVVLDRLAHTLDGVAQRRFGRSLRMCPINTGACTGCDLEIQAVGNTYYDIERFGIRLVAAPREADMLLVPGRVTMNMREALLEAHAGAPNARWVVAIGDCARDGGCFAGSYAVAGGISKLLKVDLHIPGCPPPPLKILQGLVGLLLGDSSRTVQPRGGCHEQAGS
jgi:Ni,Fe-hydrogenase III small subunit